MTTVEIEKYLRELNDELRATGVKGEISLYGGAVMCLAFNARLATKDVDAVFVPIKHIRRAAGVIAARHGLRKDWLNYAVRIFLTEHQKRVLLVLSHLTVYVPEPDYLLAMKALAGRVDSKDRDDLIFLIRELNIESGAEVVEIVSRYYPHKQIKPETQAFIEELFSSHDQFGGTEKAD
ncbi:MAG: hypothetical protein H0T45_19040 [Pyrinomonadaceae bacterium]|nr:hypothetical protein [Pyrinomonadaceae bacterium]